MSTVTVQNGSVTLGELVNWLTFLRPNVNFDQLTNWFPIDKWPLTNG